LIGDEASALLGAKKDDAKDQELPNWGGRFVEDEMRASIDVPATNGRILQAMHTPLP
jgi:hypothetical protein